MPARSADDAARGARPELVRSRVAVAFRGLALVRLFESGVLGLSAALLAGAAALHEGAAPWSAGTWLAGALCGALVGVTWALEQRRTPLDVARAADRALGEEGALVTAWEYEGGRAGALGALLAREVAARHGPRALLQAVLPPTAPLLALPFLAAGALFLALDARRTTPREADVTALALRLADEVGDLSSAGAGAGPEGTEALDAETQEALRALARDAGRLAREGASGASRAEELAALQEHLDELQADAPAGSALAETLNRAATTVDSARRALEPGGAGGASTAQEGGGEVAPGGGDGTMSGLQPPPETADGPSGASAPARGVAAGVAWPRAYDGLVARWVAARRARGE